MIIMIKTYSEMITFHSFEDRFEYLKMSGSIGIDTFGFDRYLNQIFYNCKEWQDVRRIVIIRDCGCDLGIEGREIPRNIIVHHLNPISVDQVTSRNPIIFDPEFLVTTNLRTHNGIHYGSIQSVTTIPVIRRPNDTTPWRR